MLFISCGEENGSLIIQPSQTTKYANVLFKPGKDVLQPKDDKAGTFTVVLQLGATANASTFKLAELARADG